MDIEEQEKWKTRTNDLNEMMVEREQCNTPELQLKWKVKYFWKIEKWEVRDNLLKHMYSDDLVEALIKLSPPTEVEYRERLVKMLEHSKKNG